MTGVCVRLKPGEKPPEISSARLLADLASDEDHHVLQLLDQLLIVHEGAFVAVFVQ